MDVVSDYASIRIHGERTCSVHVLIAHARKPVYLHMPEDMYIYDTKTDMQACCHAHTGDSNTQINTHKNIEGIEINSHQ